MKYINRTFIYLFLFGLYGCQTQEINPDIIDEALDVPFTLMATYGDAETKLTLDDDDLGTTWQPGDEIYLIDDATGRKITLVSTITAPTKKASFKAESDVPSGNYIVLYGIDEIYYSSIGIGDIVGDPKKLNFVLYGSLKVSEGQKSANVSLSFTEAKLTFKFKNLPKGVIGMDMGMAVTPEGLINPNGFYTISQSGLALVGKRNEMSGPNIKMLSFGWSGADTGYILTPPIDLSSKTVYFYINGEDTNNNSLITYEFIKEGIDLKAGHNYNVTFDFNKASTKSLLKKSRLSKDAYSLNTPAEFRAASYQKTAKTYSIESDVDFNNEVYFPIKASFLYGHKHTLSNININLEKCDDVGVISMGSVDSLFIRNCTIKGYSNVGGVCGKLQSSCSSCAGTSVCVSGTYYVGGLFGTTYLGWFDSDIECTIGNCILRGDSSVSGTQCVGGIVGCVGSANIIQCGYEGDVIGAEYVGGILGRTAARDRRVTKCYVKGKISGKDIVGGICGSSSARSSYVIGNVISDSNCNCGGISGIGHESEYCYSYGYVSSGFGIAPELNSYFNLTSSSKLSSDLDCPSSCGFGPNRPFTSLLSRLGESSVYSTQVWKGIDAQCPLLKWQADLLNGDIDAPGFGNEDW